ncbi:Thioredoxin-related protein [Flavobacterium micromati]|uniref:Thioredoxin-related protein n=1 Tax=Flavobacterium micromati TaxID=229205 RepID=A0A1M5J982_9FLAO|nr:thioredoxin family protein [Flavobacterium micromati]MCL6462467.1 thioredoxin family protein [Flavobacterium micromati]SHG37128.1 Thioredoxin-related protein [Flavobacterium micromati]
MKNNITYIMLLLGTIGFSQNWKTNFEDAKNQAIIENKNIVLVFSGSDWCAPCIKLDNNIWQSEEFKKEAEQKWIVYKADFPKKKANLLPAAVTANNKKLADRYNKSGNFPLVLLLDKSGTILGITGYKNVSPQEYIQLIHSFEK